MSGSRAAPAGDPRRILALGGGGFTMGERNPALDRFVLELTGKVVPRVCFLPTASGDEREQVARFYERFSAWPCQPSTLSLFHLGRDRVDPRSHLLGQDAIYAGGGSMRNLLAIWREHGVDEVMRAAWENGTVLAGLSAGAMCWFQGGISMSGGRPEVVRGIGLLPHSLSVHRDSEPARLPAYRQAISRRLLPPGHAADDSAALVYAGTELLECVGSRSGAGVIEVIPSHMGTVEERLPVRMLPGAGAGAGTGLGPPADHDELAVSELRTLRAGRRRWD